jgi:hypothetical protein
MYICHLLSLTQIRNNDFDKVLSQLSKQNKNNPEKFKTYIDLIRKTKKRLDNKEEDYPGRTSARKDKYLIPSNRTSSFPELSGISTRTKNPKKLRKQRALGEIT